MVKELLTDDLVVSTSGFVGVILTIFFSIYKYPKKIKYTWKKTNEGYLLAFWNAGLESISYEDLYEFQVYILSHDPITEINDDFQEVLISPEIVVSSEIPIWGTDDTIPQVPLEFEYAERDAQEKEKNYCDKLKIIKLTFNHMNKKSGYCIHIKYSQKEQEHNVRDDRLIVCGKIKGGGNNAIAMRKSPKPKKKTNKLKATYSLICDYMVAVPTFVIIGLLAIGYIPNKIIACFVIFLLCFFCYILIKHQKISLISEIISDLWMACLLGFSFMLFLGTIKINVIISTGIPIVLIATFLINCWSHERMPSKLDREFRRY